MASLCFRGPLGMGLNSRLNDEGTSCLSSSPTPGAIGVWDRCQLFIGVSVVSAYDEKEGVPHHLELRSLCTDEVYVAVTKSKPQAVGLVHHLSTGFQEGEYEVRVRSPFGFDLTATRQFAIFSKGAYRIVTLRLMTTNFVQFKITRKQSILYDLPVQFKVGLNPSVEGDKPFYELKGESQVAAFTSMIEAEALRQGIDPNLAKAIMYMETTHGWYDAPLAKLDKNRSILPMNVRSDYWADLGFSREELKEPEHNISAGILLLKRIWDRVPDPSVEKVATLYQDLGATKVSKYGARVGKIYADKLWKK